MIYNRNEEHFFANPATEIKINLNEMKNYEHAMYRWLKLDNASQI